MLRTGGVFDECLDATILTRISLTSHTTTQALYMIHSFSCAVSSVLEFKQKTMLNQKIFTTTKQHPPRNARLFIAIHFGCG